MVWPEPQGILENYARHVDALRWAGAGDITTDSRSGFYKWSRDALDDALKGMRGELDRATVLVLCASIEAALRTDYTHRVTQKRKDAMARRFRKLDRQFGERVPLDDILDAWRDELGGKQKFGRLKGLYKHRHWLAHGRHWVDKSGFAVAPDPEQAWLLAAPCLEAIQAAFPLT